MNNNKKTAFVLLPGESFNVLYLCCDDINQHKVDLINSYLNEPILFLVSKDSNGIDINDYECIQFDLESYLYDLRERIVNGGDVNKFKSNFKEYNKSCD